MYFKNILIVFGVARERASLVLSKKLSSIETLIILRVEYSLEAWVYAAPSSI